jgi:hypothetical protein
MTQPSRRIRTGYGLLLVSLSLALLAGCYTQVEGPGRKKNGPGTSNGNVKLELPQGHRPIDEIIAEQDSWQGRSLLDEMIGTDEPLRFENLRQNKKIMMPAEHAEFTLRVMIGNYSYYDIWQVRVDEFGWVVGAHWIHVDAGPELDESTATRRQEFRISSESEAAVRALVIALLPLNSSTHPSPVDRIVPAPTLQNLPDGFWDFDDSGMIEISYRVESLGEAHSEDWPHGKISVPAEIIQVLIGTWSTEPPRELQDLVWRTVEQEPLLIDLAIVVEAIVLAWQVEGETADVIDLPLWVFE